MRSADAQYTQETGKTQVDRKSLLWKTYRNIGATEEFPDLWDQFRDDLSASERMGVHPMMTNANDPDLGSQALGRQGQSAAPIRDLTKPETFPTGEDQQKPQPVGGGFSNRVNPELVKPQGGFPTNQQVDGITHVFQSVNRVRGEGIDLDTTLGEVRKPLDPGVRPWEQIDGHIIRNPELQVLQPGQQAQPLEKGKRYIWAIDKKGNLRIGVETEVAPGESLGHPTLTEDGTARVGGEIKFNEESKQWRINDESGRYSRGRKPGKRAEILNNVHELFDEAGLNVSVKYSK